MKKASTALVKVREQLARVKQSAGKKTKRFAEAGTDAVMIGGVALGAGYIQGKFGAVKVPKTNVPADLAGAAVLYYAGVFQPFGIKDSIAHQARNAAHGLLASHLTAVGRGAGKKSRAKAGKPPLVEGQQDSELASFLDGMMARDGGGTLSDDDLVRLASGV